MGNIFGTKKSKSSNEDQKTSLKTTSPLASTQQSVQPNSKLLGSRARDAPSASLAAPPVSKLTDSVPSDMPPKSDIQKLYKILKEIEQKLEGGKDNVNDEEDDDNKLEDSNMVKLKRIIIRHIQKKPIEPNILDRILSILGETYTRYDFNNKKLSSITGGDKKNYKDLLNNLIKY
jgi:hypothetical protein